VISRHKIRELAVQSLFSIESTKDTPDDAISSTMQLCDLAEDRVPDYLTFLVSGVIENEDDLDKKIAEHLKNKWTVKRLSRIDRAILHVGLFEMENSLEVPRKVAIDEAIELAGEFGHFVS